MAAASGARATVSCGERTTDACRAHWTAAASQLHAIHSTRKPAAKSAAGGAAAARDRCVAETSISIGAADGSIIAIIMMLHIAPAARRSGALHGADGGIAIFIPPPPVRAIAPARCHRSNHASAVAPAMPATVTARSRGRTAVPLPMAQPAQENGAEWPFLPVLEKSRPNAFTRDRVAFATVNVEFAGWKIPVIFVTSPDLPWGGARSSTSMSTALPILTECRRPSSRY